MFLCKQIFMSQKILGPKIFGSIQKNFLDPKKNLIPKKFFATQNSFWSKIIFGLKQILCLKKFLGPKMFVAPNIFWGAGNFQVENMIQVKLSFFFCEQKCFRVKNISKSENIFGTKIFRRKNDLPGEAGNITTSAGMKLGLGLSLAVMICAISWIHKVYFEIFKQIENHMDRKLECHFFLCQFISKLFCN